MINKTLNVSFLLWVAQGVGYRAWKLGVLSGGFGGMVMIYIGIG